MNTIENLISELIKKNDKGLPLDEVRTIYLNRCKHTNRYETYKYYNKHLDVIISYLKRIKVNTTKDITNNSIYRFIEFEKAKGNKNNTINKRLETLKQALKYCVSQEYIDTNPMSNFKLLDKDDIETVIIQKDILNAVFAFFQTAPSKPHILRSRAIVYILLDTGIRRNELRQLKVTDLDLENNQINLKFTKTKKHRSVFITDYTKQSIEEYISVVKPTDYLLIDDISRRQLTYYGMYKFFEEIKRKLNLPGEISLSFHKFRHTYATTCLEQGASLEFIRKTLGHSSITITQKYLHLSNNKLKDEHKVCTPINILNLDNPLSTNPQQLK
ncbi:tyrosine-type recombinase/integrase [Mycoplasmatota bacterium]|nr:tyrosine-type recombinase/integrase [Mycoplasmatota bacterium]